MELPLFRKRLVYALFALSGFCALIYEILWTKYLSLTFGTTMSAVSTVAATFMGGIALGSYLLGRFADRGSNLLKLYAFLEFGIAVTALMFAPTLALVEAFYVWLAENYAHQGSLVSFCRFFIPAMLLLPPSVCMGGTFPLMCRFFARNKSGGQIGRLYALNTLGATLGAFCAGYVFIPLLGLSTTGYMAVGGSLLAGGATLWISRGHGAADADGLVAASSSTFLRPQRHRLVMLSIGMIGFFSLAYEILWTRLLLLFLGNTSYAFSLMLAAYLVGIALGGALYSRMVRPQLNEKRLFVILAALMAFSVLATVPFYDQLAYVFQFAHDVSKERWWHLSLLSFLIVFFVIGLPTILSGALLPAAVAIANPGKEHTGEGVGMVVLHNTVGAMLGSLAAGFLLIPWLGLQRSFIFLAILNLLLALGLMFRYRDGLKLQRWHGIPAVLAAALALVAVLHQWNPVLLTSGVYCYAAKYRLLGGMDAVIGSDPVLELLEGPETTVGVHETGDRKVRYFTVNGKVDGGSGSDMATQTLIGQLPLLIHSNPQDVFVIGLGTGITLGGVREHPVKTIKCAEISSEVVKASHHFDFLNHRPLADPRVDLVVGDGRNLLLTKQQTYDVIISQPSNPWQSGNANLFTADFYRLAERRLSKGGLFCQWIGLYDITPENLRSASQTFLETFPHVLVFKENADLIMIGATEKINLDYQQIRQRLLQPPIAQVLAPIGIRSVGDLLARQYLFCDQCLVRFAAGAPLNTDDKPILEYSAHHILGRNALGTYTELNLGALMQTMRHEQLPLVGLGSNVDEITAALKDLGRSYVRHGKQAEGNRFLKQAEQFRPKS